MGNICAKNEAGRVATDAPIRKPEARQKELTSSQMQAAPKETRWVSSGKHFATAAGGNDETLVEAEAKKWADEYCTNNPQWKYTGKWKNEQEGEGLVSFIQVVEVDQPPKSNIIAAVEAKVAQQVEAE